MVGDRYRKVKVENKDMEVDLRTPQKEALTKMGSALAGKTKQRFMVVLPTGVGKTAVIALAPFMLPATTKVLVVAPNLTIYDQLAASLRNFYKTNHNHIHVTQFDWKQQKAALSDHVVVANVDKFFYQSSTLTEKAQEFLRDFAAELILIDEGHHVAADTYQVCLSK